jgi:hypothetical protein
MLIWFLELSPTTNAIFTRCPLLSAHFGHVFFAGLSKKGRAEAYCTVMVRTIMGAAFQLWLPSCQAAT